MDKSQDTMQRYVSDMLAVVRHVHDAVNRQKTDPQVVSRLEVYDLLQKISQVLDGMLAELRRHSLILSNDADRPKGSLVREGASLIKESGALFKETVASTLGQAAGMVDMMRPNKISLLLRDDYVAMHMAAIAYSMLEAAALALNYKATADIAHTQLAALTPLIMEVNELIPKVVVSELVDEGGEMHTSIVDEVLKSSQAAWDYEHIHQGHDHNRRDQAGQQPGAAPV